ncbi:MAG TPA: uracil-DNA glycosylase [Geobacter sp.]|nr:uracil-DNA glycosylase [Geobacter sp.]
MVVRDERESLLRSLKGYLEDLVESGVDELAFGEPDLPSPRETIRRAEPIPEQPRRTEPVSQESGPLAAAGPALLLEGNPQARLLFIAAGTGFSSAGGELLEKIIVAMRHTRDQVCLLSFDPCSGAAADSLAATVADRIAAIAPEVVVTLGEAATRMLVQSEEPLEQLRGRFHESGGIPTMPSFHPEALLADETLKRDVWNDMQQVMRRLEQPR